MPDFTTYLRAIIALTVVGVTLWLTVRNVTIASEWEAVFLVVIGYYFKDRPSEEAYNAKLHLENADRKETLLSRAFSEEGLELSLQFFLALILIIGTVFAFVYPSFKQSISGAWIGAVALAIAFYFKESDVSGIRRVHHFYRAFLALLVTLSTIPLLVAASRTSETVVIPLQWVGLVFVVVTFYFKERDSNQQKAASLGPNENVQSSQ